MRKFIEKAKVLVEALPYIKEFNGITIVIKYGGSALVNGEIRKTLMQDIALMKYVGFKPVIVHGGGPEINAMLARLGIKSRFVNGIRVTDEQTMEVVEMVLTGKLNKEITTDLTLHGIHAAGISGKDGATLQAKRMRPGGEDIGFVGEVTHVDTTLLKTLVENDFVPVISPVGADAYGRSYNINADYAAVKIAGALRADKLVFLTDVEGVLQDPDDPSSVLSRVTYEDIRKMIADGVISGGMLPKVECCMAAVEAGVQHVHILDGQLEHSLILEIFTKDGIGTLIEN